MIHRLKSPPTRNPRRKRAQSGYILLLLLITVAILAIMMTAAATRMVHQIKRDRETEMIHRGEQYARAVKKFVKKMNTYPTSIEQLEKTNNIRFLRKRYKDPMTPDGKWKLLHQGDIMGLSGGLPTSVMPGGGPGGPSTSSLPGSELQRKPLDAPNPDDKQQSSSSGSSLFSSSITGQTFGGGPIYGVASMSEQKGIREFNNKKKYNQWLFVYVLNQDLCSPQSYSGCIIKGPYNPQAGMTGPNKVGTPVQDLNKGGDQPPPTNDVLPK